MLENLHLALLKKREKSGLMQKFIAKQANLSEHRLSSIVYGRLTATPKERTALARVLGVDEAYLFADGQEQPAAATAIAKG